MATYTFCKIEGDGSLTRCGQPVFLLPGDSIVVTVTEEDLEEPPLPEVTPAEVTLTRQALLALEARLA